MHTPIRPGRRAAAAAMLALLAACGPLPWPRGSEPDLRPPGVEGVSATGPESLVIAFDEDAELDTDTLHIEPALQVREVSAPGRIVRIQTLGEGDELGWSSLLEEESKRFQARSLEPGRALAFLGTQLRQACEEDCAFGYALERQIIKVISSRLQATRLQLLDLYAPRGVKPI